MRNLYPGRCFKCGRKLEKYAGFFQVVRDLPPEVRRMYIARKWVLRCEKCVGTGNKLSPPTTGNSSV